MYNQQRNRSSQIDPTYFVPGLPMFEKVAEGWIEIFSRLYRFITVRAGKG